MSQYDLGFTLISSFLVVLGACGMPEDLDLPDGDPPAHCFIDRDTHPEAWERTPLTPSIDQETAAARALEWLEGTWELTSDVTRERLTLEVVTGAPEGLVVEQVQLDETALPVDVRDGVADDPTCDWIEVSASSSIGIVWDGDDWGQTPAAVRLAHGEAVVHRPAGGAFAGDLRLTLTGLDGAGTALFVLHTDDAGVVVDEATSAPEADTDE